MKLTDGERIRRRKQTELEWAAKWKGRMTERAAMLDLWRTLHRRGCISLESFQRFKRENGFCDVETKSLPAG